MHRGRPGPAVSATLALPAAWLGRYGAEASRQPSGVDLVSACLIVRDEEANLAACLAALHLVVDEVIVYDTGSTDRTVEVARAAGATVVEGGWSDDFAAARNAALEHCGSTWVLHVDADEVLECEPAGLRAALLHSDHVDAFAVEIYNLTGDGSQAGLTHQAYRLFQRRACHWAGRVHEQVVLRPSMERDMVGGRLADVLIVHSGYLDEVMAARDKLARNLRLAAAAMQDCDGQAAAVAAVNLAKSLIATGRHREATTYLETAVAELQHAPARRMALLHGIEAHLALGDLERALEWCSLLEDASAIPDVARFFRAVIYRRQGDLEASVALLEGISSLRTEDGYAMPDGILQGERSAALLDAGRLPDAADELLALIEQSGNPLSLVVAADTLHSAGRSLADLAQAVSEPQLLRAAAALTVMAPAPADELATGLWTRFGDRPEILAASIRFAPRLPVGAALEWSARLRGIAMAEACPLIARSRDGAVDGRERLRAAATAAAAFGDDRAPDLVLGAAGHLGTEELSSALAELLALSPRLVGSFAAGAATTPDRCTAVADSLTGHGMLDAAGAVRAHGAALTSGATP